MISYQQYSEYLFYKAGLEGIPLSGTFELTSRCNLDCRMCYIHRRANDAAAIRRERSAGEWIDLARQCQQAGMLLLLLTGGEPLLRQDFQEIYTECKKLGIMISINTNGTMIDEKMVDFFASNPPARLNITLYGASPETYRSFCGDGSAYEKVTRAIDLLRAAGLLVKLNYSVTQYNLQDAGEIFKFAQERELPVQCATYMFPPVRACEQGACGSERMTPEESAAAQMICDRYRYSEEQLRTRWEQLLSGVRPVDADAECQELPTERIRCRAGHTTFWVTWDGQVRPCGMMTEPSVSLAEASFAEAWQQIHQLRNEIYLPAACSSCESRHACEICPALSYAETGSFTGKPEYLCQKTAEWMRLVRQAAEQG